MASNFYREKDSPKYVLGHALELGFLVAGFIAVLFLRFNYGRINRKRAGMMQSLEVKEADMSDMGDRAPTFRYVL